MAEIKEINNLKSIIPIILNSKLNEFSVNYDKEADVLYISLRRPQKATDTETLDNGILIRYSNDEIVGYTILNASKQL